MKLAAYTISLLQKASSEGARGRAIAGFLSSVLKLVAPRSSRIDSNLRLVYPEKDREWRREIKRRLYEHLAWMITEVLVLQKKPSRALSWVKKIEGPENLDFLLSSGKGALILGAHFGNWELLGAWCSQTLMAHGKKLYVLVQEIRDPDINHLVEEYRKRSGIECLSKDISTLELVRLLKTGAFVATMADVSWCGGVRLPFMGQPCTNTVGPAVLAALASVPAVPLGIYRRGPFSHEVRFFDPLEAPKGKNRRLNAELFTAEINKALTRIVEPQPELWFWLHNRWK